MGENILVPVLGESITEATVTKWLKKKGESVEVDEAVVELETDKVNLEVPAPSSGIISEIKSKDGDTVEVGTILGIISDSNVKVESNNEEKKPDIKTQENPTQNNVINLEVEKKKDTNKIQEPLILNEEPLVLTNEIKNLLSTKGETTINLVFRNKNKQAYYALEENRKFDLNHLKTLKAKKYVEKITV